MRSMVLSDTFRRPSPTEVMYVRWTPTSAANASWNNPPQIGAARIEVDTPRLARKPLWRVLRTLKDRGRRFGELSGQRLH